MRASWMLKKSGGSHGLCRAKCETRLVSLVYLVCLVELDYPDEQNKPDEPDQLVPPVSLGDPPGAYPVVPDMRTIGFEEG